MRRSSAWRSRGRPLRSNMPFILAHEPGASSSTDRAMSKDSCSGDRTSRAEARRCSAAILRDLTGPSINVCFPAKPKQLELGFQRTTLRYHRAIRGRYRVVEESSQLAQIEAERAADLDRLGIRRDGDDRKLDQLVALVDEAL